MSFSCHCRKMYGGSHAYSEEAARAKKELSDTDIYLVVFAKTTCLSR